VPKLSAIWLAAMLLGLVHAAALVVTTIRRDFLASTMICLRPVFGMAMS
jgi:hypothetical protein